MAVRKHLLRLLLAAMATLFTCGQAFAAEQVQRYSFELHGGEPLTGSRYDQPVTRPGASLMPLISSRNRTSTKACSAPGC